MDTINLRITQFAQAMGMNPNQFAREVGYKRPDNIYNVLAGRTKPSWEMLEAIARRFEALDTNWLLRGTGHMFHEPPVSKAVEATSQDNQGAVPVVSTSGSEQASASIPLVPIRAQAGYLKLFQDTDYLRQLARVSLPGFTGDTFRAFEAEGDSMQPVIRHSDYVIGSPTAKHSLRPHYVYVFVTDGGVAIQRLSGIRSEQVELSSDNAFYPSYPIALTDIREIWQVRGIFTSLIAATSQELPPKLAGRLETIASASAKTQQLLQRLLEKVATAEKS